MDKYETRKLILSAKKDFNLNHADMARLLVGQGRGSRGTYEKWVSEINSSSLQKASKSAIKHIHTLYFIRENQPLILKEIILFSINN